MKRRRRARSRSPRPSSTRGAGGVGGVRQDRTDACGSLRERRVRRSPVRRLARRNEIGVRLPRSAVFQHAINTGRRDGEPAGLVALDESLLAQVPEMERHERLGAAERALELDRSDRGVRVVVSPRHVQQRKDGVAYARVGGDLAAGRLLVEDPPLRRLHLLVREGGRSEEHTSELQSRLHLVCRLLLEKKKKKQNKNAGQKQQVLDREQRTDTTLRLTA